MTKATITIMEGEQGGRIAHLYVSSDGQEEGENLLQFCREEQPDPDRFDELFTPASFAERYAPWHFANHPGVYHSSERFARCEQVERPRPAEYDYTVTLAAGSVRAIRAVRVGFGGVRELYTVSFPA